jgi:hypothetical protein
MRNVEELLDTPVDVVIEHEPMQPRRASEAAAAASSERPAPDAPLGTDAVPQTSEGADAPLRSSPPPAEAPPPREQRGLHITKTAFVRPQTGEPYFKIEAVARDGEPHVFMTRDEALYKEAASFEGTDHAVAIHFALRKMPEGERVVAVLQGIAIDETTPATSAAADSGTLFK